MLRLALLALTAACLAVPTAGAQEEQDPEAFRLLVFSKTAGFRHGSIGVGVKTVEALGAEHHFAVDHTEDAGQFTPENLKQYAVVMFLNTTGDVLNEEQQGAFESFVRTGHGYVGVHSAADTEYDWPWYGKLVGAYFKSHPRIQEATVKVEDREHICCRHLPADWVRTDEWYTYRASPREDVTVLLSLDESTYEGGGMGDHPICWCHEFDGGRAWYTGGGHTNESYAEPGFRQHLLGGILWAANREDMMDDLKIDQDAKKAKVDKTNPTPKTDE